MGYGLWARDRLFVWARGRHVVTMAPTAAGSCGRVATMALPREARHQASGIRLQV
jgi:hypothetical protein